MKVSKVETIQIELDGSTHILTHEDARNLCIKIAKLTGLQVSMTRAAAMNIPSMSEMGADAMAKAFDDTVVQAHNKRSLDPSLDDRPGHDELEDVLINVRNNYKDKSKVLDMVGAHKEIEAGTL